MDFPKVDNGFLDLLFVPIKAIEFKIWVFWSTLQHRWNYGCLRL